jgi:hypothetical protein
MKPNLRLVKSEDEEKLLFKRKEDEAQQLLQALIVQALCFKRLKDYGIISQFYHNYQKDKNVDVYLECLGKLRYLFTLGTPSDNEIKTVKIALAQIKLLTDVPYYHPENQKYSLLLSKMIFRAALFKRTEALNKLAYIATEFRAYQNLTNLQLQIKPYLYLNSSSMS